MSQADTPVVGSAHDAQAYHFLDTLSYVQVPGDATDGRQAVVEMQFREGHAPPMHVHENADETIHVLEGQLEAHTADDVVEVPAGDTVVFTSGVEHSIVAVEPTKALVTTTPAGFDEFVAAVGEATDTEEVPDTPPDKAAIERVNELAPEYDIEIVGPPPVEP